MLDNVNKLFSSHLGASVYKDILRAISDFSMEKKIRGGVLVGLSGGADSVMLLLSLLKYRSENFDFPILAVHINHLIRGQEAFRDEEFSRSLCKSLQVEFLSRKIDVPALSAESGNSIEEAARNARYNCFREIIQSRNDIKTVAVAHNADDNFETVIINMMRGTGTRGVAGISPSRDDIVRPLIYLKKTDIVGALKHENIDFVTDSTNESDDYTRNYIRHNIFPLFSRAFEGAYSALEKMCRNLREDDECLFDLALKFSQKHKNGKIPLSELKDLPSSLLYRVLKIYFDGFSGLTLERVHIDAIKACLGKNSEFSISVPGGASFTAKDGLCGFSYNEKKTHGFSYHISDGETEISDFSALVLLTHGASADYSSKVYNISTQANLSSAIIKGDLFIRNKLDGDSCFWGGMTHKLKKLFNDKKLPSAVRPFIPVLCDEDGVVWIPGFGVRDDGGGGDLHIRISVNSNAEGAFYLPIDYKKAKTNKKG